MSSLSPLAPSIRRASARSEWTAILAMVLFIASWLIMFAGLFFVYSGVRLGTETWPPLEYPPPPLGRALLNTGVVAISSGVLFGAARQSGRAQSVGVLVSGLLGVIFLALQWAMWSDLHSFGFTVRSGTYGASFFALTWLHAAHVAVGAIANLEVGRRLWLGRDARLSMKLWSMYWHFVGAVWLFLVVSVFWV